MKKLLCIFMIFSLLYICGCGKKCDSEILGQWELDGNIYTFDRRGNAKVNGEKFKFSALDGTLILKNDAEQLAVPYNSDGETLTINGVKLKKYENKAVRENVIWDYINRYLLKTG